jgi:hypothetical protein
VNSSLRLLETDGQRRGSVFNASGSNHILLSNSAADGRMSQLTLSSETLSHQS